MKQLLNPSSVPASPFYSQGVSFTGADKLVFVSGQVGVTPDGETLVGIEEQSRQAAANVNAVVADAGLSSTDIAKLTIYLTDPEHLMPFMMAAAGSLPTEPPATTLLIVQALADPALLVEIEAIAVGSPG